MPYLANSIPTSFSSSVFSNLINRVQISSHKKNQCPDGCATPSESLIETDLTAVFSKNDQTVINSNEILSCNQFIRPFQCPENTVPAAVLTILPQPALAIPKTVHTLPRIENATRDVTQQPVASFICETFSYSDDMRGFLDFTLVSGFQNRVKSSDPKIGLAWQKKRISISPSNKMFNENVVYTPPPEVNTENKILDIQDDCDNLPIYYEAGPDKTRDSDPNYLYFENDVIPTLTIKAKFCSNGGVVLGRVKEHVIVLTDHSGSMAWADHPLDWPEPERNQSCGRYQSYLKIYDNFAGKASDIEKISKIRFASDFRPVINYDDYQIFKQELSVNEDCTYYYINDNDCKLRPHYDSTYCKTGEINGGTNYEAGLAEAREAIINNSPETIKYLFMITDGEATKSYGNFRGQVVKNYEGQRVDCEAECENWYHWKRAVKIAEEIREADENVIMRGIFLADPNTARIYEEAAKESEFGEFSVADYNCRRLRRGKPEGFWFEENCLERLAQVVGLRENVSFVGSAIELANKVQVEYKMSFIDENWGPACLIRSPIDSGGFQIPCSFGESANFNTHATIIVKTDADDPIKLSRNQDGSIKEIYIKLTVKDTNNRKIIKKIYINHPTLP
jgi:hypothetical protein